MVIGYLLLSAASFLLLLDIYTLSRKGSSKKSLWRSSSNFVLSTLCILAAFFVYVNSFLNNNYALKDVYSYSSADLSILYKFYASWAGIGGSLLLWSIILNVICLMYRISHRTDFELNKSSYIYLNTFLLFIVAATILADPFAGLSFRVAGGLGLNPLLQSPWMAIHPPIIFLGYSLPFFPLAFSLSNLSKGKDEHASSINFFMKMSWLVFTLGIALGGVWAYEVLGWGGYWSWDPVETASLLPWLMLTAYFHTTPLSSQGRSLTREFSIFASSLLVIFATITTRSGLLESVHAFEASVTGTALPFIMLSIYLVGYFIYLKWKVNKPVFRLSIVTASKDSIALATAYVALLYITMVCLLGISLPAVRSVQLGSSYSVGKEFYNTWLLPPTILFVGALICCNAPKKMRSKYCVAVVILAILCGFIAAILGIPTPNQMANLGIPVLLVALAFSSYTFLGGLANLRSKRFLSTTGRSLIHASLVIILLGVFLSSSMETNDQRILKIGEVYSGDNFTLKLTNLTLSGPSGSVYTYNGTLPEHSSLEFDILASSHGSSHGGRLWTGLYTVYGMTSRPLIFRSLLRDIYITAGFSDQLYQAMLIKLSAGKQSQLTQFAVQVKVIPFVSLIWIGVSLFSLGIVLSMVYDHKRK